MLNEVKLKNSLAIMKLIDKSVTQTMDFGLLGSTAKKIITSNIESQQISRSFQGF